MGGRGRPLPPRPRTAREPRWGLRQGGFRPIGWQIPGRGHCRRVPSSQPTAAGKIRRSPRTWLRPRRSVPGIPRKPSRSRIAVRVVDAEVPGRRRPGDEGHHSPQCRRIFSITSPCGGSMKATTFIWPPQSRTGQRVDLVHPLDEHGPGLAAAAAGRNRCGLSARVPVGWSAAAASALPCAACRGPCSSTSRNSESGARPSAECAA